MAGKWERYMEYRVPDHHHSVGHSVDRRHSIYHISIANYLLLENLVMSHVCCTMH